MASNKKDDPRRRVTWQEALILASQVEAEPEPVSEVVSGSRDHPAIPAPTFAAMVIADRVPAAPIPMTEQVEEVLVSADLRIKTRIKFNLVQRILSAISIFNRWLLLGLAVVAAFLIISFIRAYQRIVAKTVYV